MSLNPKNILKLLCLTFEDPVYNIESRITDEERSFASQLADLIKDAINFDIFKETYDTLNCTDASVIPDAVLVGQSRRCFGSCARRYKIQRNCRH